MLRRQQLSYCSCTYGNYRNNYQFLCLRRRISHDYRDCCRKLLHINRLTICLYYGPQRISNRSCSCFRDLKCSIYSSLIGNILYDFEHQLYRLWYRYDLFDDNYHLYLLRNRAMCQFFAHFRMRTSVQPINNRFFLFCFQSLFHCHSGPGTSI